MCASGWLAGFRDYLESVAIGSRHGVLSLSGRSVWSVLCGCHRGVGTEGGVRLDLMEAIYSRRSVRSYTEQSVHKATIEVLIQAAIQAPSALNQQPWAFAVIHDGQVLAQYSDHVKAQVLKGLTPQSPLYAHRQALESPAYNVFYGAGTLIVICAKPEGVNAEEDCSLAAQNLMLAAHAMGLGTCPIGFARPWLNLEETKRDLAIPMHYTVVFPVIVGYPTGLTPPVARKEPEIVGWR